MRLSYRNTIFICERYLGSDYKVFHVKYINASRQALTTQFISLACDKKMLAWMAQS